jgi:hypothetical protein
LLLAQPFPFPDYIFYSVFSIGLLYLSNVFASP